MDKINGNTLDYVEADRKEAIAIKLMKHYYDEYCRNLTESYEWTWVDDDGKIYYCKQYDVYQERAMNNYAEFKKVQKELEEIRRRLGK